MLKKLSLATLVAMGSASFAGAATDLSSAIQGVKIGGFLRYRGTEINKKTDGNDNHANSTTHAYKTVLGIGIKASETMSVHGKLVARNVNTSTNAQGAGVNASNPFGVKEAYLLYKNSGAVVKAGEQFLATPLSDADVVRGNGVLATYSQNGVTGVAAYMDAISGLSNNLGVLAVVANLNPVKVQGWYYNVSDSGDDTKDGADVYFLEAAANVDVVTLKAQYSSKKGNADGAERQKFFALAAVGKVDVVSLTAAYLNFGKDGSDVKVASQADGLIAAGDISGDLIQQGALADGWGGALVAKAKVADKTTAGVQYVHAKVEDGDVKANEYDLDLSYAYSKQLKFSGYYAVLKTDEDGANDETTNKFRVEAKYSF